MKFATAAALLASTTYAADVKLIIDSDAGFDVDDIHAVAVAHGLEKQGKVDILATISSTAFRKSIAAINVINTYYGRSDIPLGAYKGLFGWDYGGQYTYATSLVDSFPNNNIKDRDDVPEAQETYVKVLNEAEDNSVTIASIGFPMNIRNMLKNHKDIFEKKVKAVYYMDGGYNFGCAAGYLGNDTDCHGAAQQVQIDFPHNVKEYFQLNGSDVCTGGDFYNNKCGDDSNPMKFAHNHWMDQRRDTCWPARPAWDPITVYAAIMGTDATNMWEEQGTDRVDQSGNENWDKGTTKYNEVHLWFTNDDKKSWMAGEINKIICAGKDINSQKPEEFL
jgi:hypothetical protein